MGVLIGARALLGAVGSAIAGLIRGAH